MKCSPALLRGAVEVASIPSSQSQVVLFKDKYEDAAGSDVLAAIQVVFAPEVLELEGQISKLSLQLERSRKEYKAAIHAKPEPISAKSQRDSKELQNDLSTCKEQLKTLEARLKAEEEKLKKHGEEQRVEGRKEGEEQMYDKIEVEVHRIKTVVEERVRAKLQVDFDREMNEVKQALGRAAGVELDNAKNRIADLERDIGNKKEECDRLKGELASKASSTDVASQPAMSRRLLELEQELKAATLESNELKAQVARLQDQVDGYKQQIRTLQQMASALKKPQPDDMMSPPSTHRSLDASYKPKHDEEKCAAHRERLKQAIEESTIEAKAFISRITDLQAECRSTKEQLELETLKAQEADAATQELRSQMTERPNDGMIESLRRLVIDSEEREKDTMHKLRMAQQVSAQLATDNAKLRGAAAENITLRTRVEELERLQKQQQAAQASMPAIVPPAAVAAAAAAQLRYEGMGGARKPVQTSAPYTQQQQAYYYNYQIMAAQAQAQQQWQTTGGMTGFPSSSTSSSSSNGNGAVPPPPGVGCDGLMDLTIAVDPARRLRDRNDAAPHPGFDSVRRMSSMSQPRAAHIRPTQLWSTWGPTAAKSSLPQHGPGRRRDCRSMCRLPCRLTMRGMLRFLAVCYAFVACIGLWSVLGPPSLSSQIVQTDDAMQRPLKRRDLPLPPSSESDFAGLYRILGNELPPRHKLGQTLINLRFILDHEPAFPGCKKWWILNRIVDTATEEAIIQLLESRGERYFRIPFELDTYKTIGMTMKHFPEKDFLRSETYIGLKKRAKMRVLDYMYHDKNQYIMNNVGPHLAFHALTPWMKNGARNSAIKHGKSRFRWILAFDGNIFINQHGWEEIHGTLSNHTMAHKYVIVPMARVVENTLALNNSAMFTADEEPQVIFRNDAEEHGLIGRQVELLWRLGVTSNFEPKEAKVTLNVAANLLRKQEENITVSPVNQITSARSETTSAVVNLPKTATAPYVPPWEAETVWKRSPSKGQFATAGYVLRLYSGSKEQESGPQASTLRTLGRLHGIRFLIDSIDSSVINSYNLTPLKRLIYNQSIMEKERAMLWSGMAPVGLVALSKLLRADADEIMNATQYVLYTAADPSEQMELPCHCDAGTRFIERPEPTDQYPCIINSTNSGRQISLSSFLMRDRSSVLNHGRSSIKLDEWLSAAMNQIVILVLAAYFHGEQTYATRAANMIRKLIIDTPVVTEGPYGEADIPVPLSQLIPTSLQRPECFPDSAPLDPARNFTVALQLPVASFYDAVRILESGTVRGLSTHDSSSIRRTMSSYLEYLTSDKIARRGSITRGSRGVKWDLIIGSTYLFLDNAGEWSKVIARGAMRVSGWLDGEIGQYEVDLESSDEMKSCSGSVAGEEAAMSVDEPSSGHLRLQEEIRLMTSLSMHARAIRNVWDVRYSKSKMNRPLMPAASVAIDYWTHMPVDLNGTSIHAGTAPTMSGVFPKRLHRLREAIGGLVKEGGNEVRRFFGRDVTVPPRSCIGSNDTIGELVAQPNTASHYTPALMLAATMGSNYDAALVSQVVDTTFPTLASNEVLPAKIMREQVDALMLQALAFGVDRSSDFVEFSDKLRGMHYFQGRDIPGLPPYWNLGMAGMD
ncbi:hypothetical protein HK101_001132 [Irineochytrium annulatum]|nr:hypothetical protein HK101_001132 [Irineochytrium annulatum]